MRLRSTLTALLLLVAARASAIDQPVSARKLVLRQTIGGEQKLAFLTKDTTLLFPAIGGLDDPASQPAGVTIELFSQNQGLATLVIPGILGWSTRDGKPSFYKFVNKRAPEAVSTVGSFLLKEARAIRVRAAVTGLASAGQKGAVGVRITTGSLRTCALFDPATIRRDDGRVYIARDAVAANLTDCSNGSLGGPTCTDGSFVGDQCGGTCPAGSTCGTQDLSTCTCISSAQPCGGTFPVCNGACPTGDECLATGGFPLPSCACLPAGSTPCSQLQCGGACPTDQECNFFEVSLPGGSGCLCGPPGACGTGGDDCPTDFHCAVDPGGSLCVPNP